MNSTPLHSVSVAGVVFNNEGHVLTIQRRDNGNWQIPGGVLERDEKVDSGVIREVEEETGLVVVPERLTGVYKNMPLCVVALVFKCIEVGGALTATEEANEVLWLPVQEAVSRMNPTFAVRVTDACEGRVVARAHDGHALL